MSEPQKPSSSAVWINLTAVYVVWGSTYLAIRFALETMPPFLLAGVRFVISGAILYAWRRYCGDKKPAKSEWRSAVTIGFLLLVGGNGGVVWAQQWVASGLAALLVSTVPLWMVVIDFLRPGGWRPDWKAVTGVTAGFCGIAVLMGPKHLLGNEVNADPVGIAVLILASLFWSIGSLYSRNARLPSSPLLGASMEMLSGGAGLLILATVSGEWGELKPSIISAQSLWALAYLIVFGSWVGFSAYTWLLRVAPTPLVSTYAYVNPLVALLLGHFLAEEQITPRVLTATAIIVGSVALTTIARPVSQRSKGSPVVEGKIERLKD